MGWLVQSTAYTASLPAAISADVWLAGRLVREDRNVITPVSTTGATHPFLRVNFDRRVFNDGQARLDVASPDTPAALSTRDGFRTVCCSSSPTVLL